MKCPNCGMETDAECCPMCGTEVNPTQKATVKKKQIDFYWSVVLVIWIALLISLMVDDGGNTVSPWVPLLVAAVLLLITLPAEMFLHRLLSWHPVIKDYILCFSLGMACFTFVVPMLARGADGNAYPINAAALLAVTIYILCRPIDWLVRLKSRRKRKNSVKMADCPAPLRKENFDDMTGPEFEQFCADLLIKNGFENVRVTPISGDYGVDVLAEKAKITYAIQCKCYASNIGNSAVQEVYSGKSYYNTMVAAVMTNRYFTAAAKETAEKNQVALWDRDVLIQMQGCEGFDYVCSGPQNQSRAQGAGTDAGTACGQN